MAIITTSQHQCTNQICEILKIYFTDDYKVIFDNSVLLQYINIKTKSVNRGSKSRGSFANLYALYVIIEDYINNGFFDCNTTKHYKEYEGARFQELLTRQRQLPFGNKLQNHALNSRLNEEFKKFFDIGIVPIIRNLKTQRYWIQEDLLIVKIKNQEGQDVEFNIAKILLEVIDVYITMKQTAFNEFIQTCQKIFNLKKFDTITAEKFIIEQLQPNIDARVFEIVSYAILKSRYAQESIWIGKTKSSVIEETLSLYKTDRTNANDGGIDFVMKPIGRFFQVTESTDVSKYFLDIDKVQRFPITFVIKSNLSRDDLLSLIKKQAESKYKISSVVTEYLQSIEEIINVHDLIDAFQEIIKNGKLNNVMNEIITQSYLEFNQVVINE